MTTTERLIVFARFPEPGQAKTRLIPTLGAQQAARLHELLARKTFREARQVCSLGNRRLEVRFAGGDRDAMSQLFGQDLHYAEQQGDGLGDRLAHAVSVAFDEGARRVVVIGTDCPDLDASRISDAFRALQNHDVVLGPALDGGYYLIGLRVPQRELFRGISWGTEQVLQQTLDIARRLKRHVHLLPALADVDHPHDLVSCRRFPTDFAGVLPQTRPGVLSIIVPVLNEAQVLAETLAPLIGLSETEVIVADGGSTDATGEIAKQSGATVIAAPRGRGRQLNTGAALASGETLLFLHADSQLPRNFRSEITTVLNSSCIAGAFRLQIDSPRRSLRWIELAANLRSRWLQMPYGDQGLFLHAGDFFQIGGFPDWPLLEDYELCRRLRRRGRIVLANESMRTSARRWNRLGAIHTTWVNQCTLLGFHLGISPEKLARWYASWMKRA